MEHLKDSGIQFHNHKVQDGARYEAILIFSSLRKQFLVFNLYILISFMSMECRLGKNIETKNSRLLWVTIV